jgi:hypothetical protein
VKDYLGFENERNKRSAKLFADILVAAYGTDIDVLVGHHVTFEHHADIASENEIPSADTLLFCHELMGRVFGAAAPEIMADLVRLPAESRDARLAEWFYARGG